MSERLVNRANQSEAMGLMVGDIRKGLVGVQSQAEQVIDAVVAGQNTLLMGTPAVGKTSLIERLGRVIYAEEESAKHPVYSRLQGTKDTMPRDVIGGRVLDPETGKLVVEEGPIFANFFLFDEINRTPEDTQAAAHEPFDEHMVHINGHTERLLLPKPFIGFGTQNENQHGQATHPMPDALLTRFGSGVYYDEPTEKDLIEAGKNRVNGIADAHIDPLISTEELIELQRAAQEINPRDEVYVYIAKVLRGLVEMDGVDALTANHRANTAAIRLAQANALRHSSGEVTLDHAEAVIPNVVTHLVKSVGYDPAFYKKQEVVSQAINDARRNTPVSRQR